MNSKELLEYVRSLRERSLNEAHQNGVTKWALGVAIFYLLFQALPNFTALRFGELSYNQFLIFFTHTMGFLIGCNWLYLQIKGNSKFSKYDYRFTTSAPKPLYKFIYFFTNEGLFLLLVFLSFSLDHFNTDLLPSESPMKGIISGEFLVLMISAMFPGLIALVLIGLMLSKNKKLDGYPTWFDVTTNQGEHFDYLFNLIIAVMLLNGYYLIYPTFDITKEDFQKYILLSFQLGLASYGMSYFLRSLRNTSKLEDLSKLERNIVLHDFTENDVKKALEEIYFGNEFETWLKREIDTLANEASSVNDLVQGKAAFFKGLEDLPQELSYERKGRISDYLKRLEDSLASAKTRKDHLVECLSSIIRFEKKDKYLLSLLNQSLEDINSTFNNQVAETNKVLQELRKLQ